MGTRNFKSFTITIAVVIYLLTASWSASGQSMYIRLRDYCKKLPAGFEEIPGFRKDSLNKIGNYILGKHEKGEPALILFADRNNAKISQLSELWFYIAQNYYKVKNVSVFSGGLEPTSFDHRIVPSIQHAGLILIPPQQYMNNLIYYINAGKRFPDYSMFAKPIDYHLNPHDHFLFVGTCPEMEKVSYLNYGAEQRVLLLWDNPSSWDDTPVEQKKYESCAAEIARDMFYIMDYVKKEEKARKKGKGKRFPGNF
ncbi:MAG: hypothetical protein GXO83_01920 [Chlorobi bacterium]|nr:hypothetical protein [Chlorobiota bacterium]